MVEFAIFTEGEPLGKMISIDPNKVQSVRETDLNPEVSRITLTDGTEYMVVGTRVEVHQEIEAAKN
ncbi:MAG: hypothetical protein KAQ88_04720 [Hyphomicrobiaceae bacterium]|jgi:hypothetical protein|nr:hypothetical protein [Hyphomicrobiaceae bacterium]